MSRVAIWRRGSNDPDTAARWLFQSGLGAEKADLLRTIRALGAYGAFLSVFGAICVLFPKTFHAIGPFGPCLVFGVGFVLSRFDKKALPPPKEPPGLGEAFEVRITIRDARGLRMGSDRGWLIFSEGWILFEGARTEFAVTRGESYRRSREPGLGLKLEDGRTVEISPITGPSIPYPLNRAFKDWEVTPIPDGEAVLPPHEVHPKIWAERHSLSSFGAIAAATVCGFGLAFGSWPVIALAAVVLGGCLIHGADCVRQLCGALRHSLSVPTPSLGGGQEGRGLATVER